MTLLLFGVSGSRGDAHINWLTSVRLYLDHTEASLKRRFGKESAEFRAFKEACASAYDEVPGYRFVYKFRNYVQHCGLPISHITVSRVENAPPHVIQRVQFLLNREQLLDNYGEWGSLVKADLAILPDTFDIDPWIDAAMGRLRLIEGVRLRLEVVAAADGSDAAAEAVSRLGEVADDEAPYLVATEQFSDGRMTFSPMPIPIDGVALLQAIKAGHAEPDSVIGPPTMPSFPLDPATVAQRLQADTRGVQAISLFMEQGGSTPEFRAGLEQIFQEDGGPDQLIAGLLNVSLVMVHSAASAIGATAQGYLSGMLNIYTRQSEFGPHQTEPNASESTEGE